jgi:RNA polymerase sigma-70 factor (ECF subfamily)
MRDAREHELIAGLRQRDPIAVAELTAMYGSRIFQMAFRHVKNREDAEEVAQDVLLKVCAKIDGFRGDAALSSWIYRITFNTAMSRLRNGRAVRHAEVVEESLDRPGNQEGAAREVGDWSEMGDEHVLRGEMRRRLIAAILELPDIYRAPVVLRDLQGLTTEEASVVLAVKGQTLKSRLHRGRTILRQRLADFAGGLTLHRPLAA